MRYLVLGGNGMLGHRVARLLSENAAVTTTVRRPSSRLPLIAPGVEVIEGFDATEPGAIGPLLEKVCPDAVINCIGIVKQREEAADEALSRRINAAFPREVAEATAARDARFVHYSTDCVFTGERGGYTEDDAPDATDVYGRSKAAGEVDDVSGAVTVRTSMIGWEIERGTSLLEWFASRRGGMCKGYGQAIFSGLATRDLACVTRELCERWTDVDGLVHVSMEPIDKLTLLTTVRDALGWDIGIEPSDEVVVDRSLDSSRFRERTGWTPPTWDYAIVRLAAERPLYDALAGDAGTTGGT